MYLRHSQKYGKDIKIIHPGEFFVSGEDEIIGTLLGSCVAVCLIDTVTGYAGMNHFMLPGRISVQDIFQDRSARYGITAINHLMAEMIKMGALRNKMTAKIFGGGHVLDTDGGITSIPQDNIKIAKVMMELEDIPITEIDVGDNFTRKLLLVVKSGKVYLRKTTKKEVYEKIYKRDTEFARTIVEKKKSKQGK
ncbi:MAG: chemotaxis protein CheD [bacterium]|nr:chemotaxis protein CheD [bacterium]